MRGGGLLLNVSEVSALENWHLIIFNQNLVPAEAGGTIEIVQPQDTIRAATVVKQGTEKLEIYNEEEYRFADPADGFVPARKHFIYGRTDDDTGLIVNDFVNISLRANAGKVITFENPVFGWLSGPNGAQIYFAQLGRLAVSSPEPAAGDDERPDSMRPNGTAEILKTGILSFPVRRSPANLPVLTRLKIFMSMSALRRMAGMCLLTMVW